MAGRTELMRWLTRTFVAIVVLAVIGLSAVAGGMYWHRVDTIASRAAGQTLIKQAGKQVGSIFGYDYQTVERSLDEQYAGLTPEYRREFEDKANREIIPQAKQRKIVSQTSIVGTGIIAAHRDSAQVVVYMNRTITDQSRTPVYDSSSIQVDYTRAGDKWLISYITPL
ncbi:MULTISPECIES: hypothetical protein [Mycobacteroides]|jgi:Mce-associated membrane protein|uniref:Mammalian cell entry protein n=2 Tax=Mycobacteroides chelonae TaxID=1774 RepID=A0AB73MH62_MYCCH|nr:MULTISPECIES: hypothetical protein [Mycobacteroides]KRQ28460.1 mammalian cell entry protein [Mycobacteroides sp. H072]KRQ41293.1 mammalian cell entry protein [Mycobacteroides sp. H002]KRQ53566.1 mammalian cell entry protein [Mycobacteroides sp. H054]KRQ69486.1 mammalian cell entry protein [Mycobacteroides sp. H001]MBF9325275.1 mammalian cell entry protein [Mycobacteroides chelonae]